MPTPSNLYINWSSVGFTPSGGTLLSITQVKSISIDANDNPIHWMADASVFATLIVSAQRSRSVTINGGNRAALAAIPVNTSGSLTFTLNDAKNGSAVGGGAIIFTLANAVRSSVPWSGSNAEFATGSITFTAYSSDGTTDPLSWTNA